MWIFHAIFCGFLDADFWVRIFFADFGVRMFFFADFVMACADFGVRIFLAVFPQKKP